MRARSLAITLAVLALIVGVARTAHADPKGDIEKKIKEAMASYDGMDYDAAKKLLNQAIATAKKGKLDKDPVAAKAYLDLGIVSFVNNDADGAKVSFVSAVQIQPRIQIDPAYKSPELAKLLDQARGEAKSSGGAATGGNSGGGDFLSGGDTEVGGADCGSVHGLQHELIDTAKAGTSLKVEATLGSDVKATKVSVMFRPEGGTDFIEVKMTKQGGCKYVGTIPASGMRGSLVHYYVAAYNDNGKPIAAKGSAGSPNIMELTGKGGPTKGDDEDPLGGKKKVAQADDSGDSSGSGSGSGSDSGGEVTASATTGATASKILLSLSLGTGVGYLAAMDLTEASNPIGSGGLGWGVLVITPEAMYAVNDHIQIGAALRLGLPLNANVDGHAAVGAAGLVRGRYSLDPNGDGVRLMAELGYGLLRNTVSLSNAQNGMNTDIVALGPLVLGAGVGWAKRLTPSVQFVADVAMLGGFAVGVSTNTKGDSSLTGAPLNNGVGFDLSAGFVVGI